MRDIQQPPSTLDGTFLNLKALKQRGWTARLVRTFLGEPDEMERVGAAHTGRPKNLYFAKRVALIETHDPQFMAEKNKASKYSDRLKQTQDSKKKNLASIVDAMTLPDFDLPFEEILDRATKKIFEENFGETTPERVALETLLDSMASLTWRLEIFGGHAGIREARVLLRTRMLAHLVNRYPPLSETAKKYADESAGTGKEEDGNENHQSSAG